MVKTLRIGMAGALLAAAAFGTVAAPATPAHADNLLVPQPVDYPDTGSLPVLPLQDATWAGGLAGGKSGTAPASAAVATAVTSSSAPGKSISYYMRSGDSNSTIQSMGYNAPTVSSGIQVVLDWGGWCSDGKSVTAFNSTCLADTTVAYRSEYWLYGYYLNSNHNHTFVTVTLGTNNSVTSNTASNATTHGKDWYTAIANKMGNYSNTLNNAAFNQGANIFSRVGGANDMETNWNAPGVTTPWVAAYNSLYGGNSTYIPVYDFGAYYGTCATSSCWNSVVDHGWTPHQKYNVQWGYNAAYSTPEIYNSSWATYYKDLNLAAVAAGTHRVNASAALWSCGTGGSEPSAAQAWADLANATGWQPPYSMFLHNQARTC